VESEPYLIWKEHPSASGEDDPRVAGRLQRRRWILGAALCALVLILIPPLPTLFDGMWFIAILTGYASAIVLALLMVLPLRRLAGWPHERISVPSHQRWGEWALYLAGAHTALLLLREPLALEYLKLSQPAFMIAGNVALILLCAIVILSLERVRVALFGPRLRFRTVHVMASIALIVLVCAHLVGSSVWIVGPAKIVLCAAVCAALVAATLKKPQARIGSSE